MYAEMITPKSALYICSSSEKIKYNYNPYYNPSEMRMGNGEGPTMSNFIVCTIHLICPIMIKSRRLRWKAHVACMKERSAFKILAGKRTWKRPLGRLRRRWEDNIRMNLKEGINMRNWVDSGQDSDY